MDFNEYQKEAMKNKVYGYGDKIIYPALGLGNEAGEVQGKIKKVLRDKGGDFSGESANGIADEIGDVLWYAAALAEDIGFTLDEIAERNIAKLTSRRERGVIQGSGDNR
jgi:NTP pyrophosphatase (non-canonical NTP hydrolase)